VHARRAEDAHRRVNVRQGLKSVNEFGDETKDPPGVAGGYFVDKILFFRHRARRKIDIENAVSRLYYGKG
jgi:hypothetical protein